MRLTGYWETAIRSLYKYFPFLKTHFWGLQAKLGAYIKALHLPCVLKVPRPSLRGRGILAEGGVQVVGDLVEVTLRLFHLFHVLSQEDCQVFRNALVCLVQENVLELCDLKKVVETILLNQKHYLLQTLDHSVQALGCFCLLISCKVS